MTPGAYLFFIGHNWRQHPWRSALPGVGIMISTCFVFLMLALGLGFMTEVYPLLEAAFPEKEIIVEPKSGDIAFLKVSAQNLNDKLIAELAQLDGVDKILPVLPLRIPAMATVNMFGNELASDITLYGVDPELIAKDITHPRGFAFEPKQPIPVIFSEYFLELYNNGMAEANGLPKLSRNSVLGRTFTLDLGESSLSTSSKPTKSLECMIVGMTKRTGIMGGMIPLEYARRLNRDFRAGSETYYSQAFVLIRSLGDYQQVREKLAAADLAVQPDYLGGIRALLLTGMGIMTLVVSSVLFLALLGLFNAFGLILRERRKFIGITRSLGLSRARLRGLILGELLFIGLFGGLLGCLAGQEIGSLVNANLQQLLGEIELLPHALFITSLPVWLVCLLLACLSSLLTPLSLIWRATNYPPSALLGSE